MKSKIISILLMAVGAVACSDSTDLPDAPPSPEDEGVAFGTVALDTRATDPDADQTGTITTENIQDFRISAYLTNRLDSMVMNNVEVRRSGPNAWTYSDPVRWPGQQEVTFEAVTPASLRMVVNPHWYTTVDITPVERIDGREYVTGTTDLCVAVNAGATQKGGKVRLNFRHAMARIQIFIAGDIPNTTVIVKEIALCNIIRHGVCYLPKKTTLPQDQTGDLNESWPGWVADQNYGKSIYFQAKDGQEVPLTSKSVSLNNRKNHFFIPMKFKALSTGGSEVLGTSIRVLAQLTSTKDGTRIWPDSVTPRQLFPNMDTKGTYAYIHIPLLDPSRGLTEWRSGYNYNYSVTVRNAGALPDHETKSGASELKAEISRL